MHQHVVQVDLDTSEAVHPPAQNFHKTLKGGRGVTQAKTQYSELLQSHIGVEGYLWSRLW